MSFTTELKLKEFNSLSGLQTFFWLFERYQEEESKAGACCRVWMPHCSIRSALRFPAYLWSKHFSALSSGAVNGLSCLFKHLMLFWCPNYACLPWWISTEHSSDNFLQSAENQILIASGGKSKVISKLIDKEQRNTSRGGSLGALMNAWQDCDESPQKTCNNSEEIEGIYCSNKTKPSDTGRWGSTGWWQSADQDQVQFPFFLQSKNPN